MGQFSTGVIGKKWVKIKTLLTKKDTTEKASISLKRKMAGWDSSYRLKLLGVK